MRRSPDYKKRDQHAWAVWRRKDVALAVSYASCVAPCNPNSTTPPSTVDSQRGKRSRRRSEVWQPLCAARRAAAVIVGALDRPWSSVCHGMQVASSLDLSKRPFPLVQIAGVDPVLQRVHGAAGLVRADARQP